MINLCRRAYYYILPVTLLSLAVNIPKFFETTTEYNKTLQVTKYFNSICHKNPQQKLNVIFNDKKNIYFNYK